MDNIILKNNKDENCEERVGGGGAPKTPRERWVVEVDVYLESVDPLEFHIESYLQSAPDTNLVFHNNRHPGFEVVFQLQDDTGDPIGYTFLKPKLNAVWSQLGDGPDFCPKEEMWEVFQPLRLTDDGMTLTVLNPNSGNAVGKFQYTLWVTNGVKTIPLDPGGDNMNGGTSRD